MYWEIIGDDVWKFVRDTFVKGMFNPKAIEILIVLIPKIDNAKRMKYFIPISCCNVIHKLITKVLVNRLLHFSR